MALEEMTKVFKVSSFTTVGHLLHINLKDHLVQYKNQIGKALLDRNPRALAVVNKISEIDNTYRNFDIEIIAKREDCTKTDEELMVVEVHENKCRFKFDFSKVYWNSRLCTEHERIVKKVNSPCDVVFDLFAGVGPFAVPIAKAKNITYANDMNPESFKWLEYNMKYNKVQKGLVQTFNMDAKDFILSTMKEKLLEEYKRIEDEQLATTPHIHIIMNLPALAPTFLPHFIGLFKSELASKHLLNSKELLELFREQSVTHTIYCYCFLKGVYDDPEAQVRGLIEEHLGRELADEQLEGIFRVRNVAPYKEMYRVDIRLDESLLFDKKEVVSIMKNTNNKSPANGTPKRVTISAPGRKRARDESVDSTSESGDSEESEPKRLRPSSYCSII